MGTVNLKMKLSAILIAAVSASPVAHDKDSSVAKSGKPMSGKPDMKPMSGHHDYKDQDGHDMDHDMEEEWKEFQDLMRHGKADNNIMNVNFAPINTNQQNWVNINTEVETDVNVNTGGKKHGKEGKVMKMMKYKLEMMKPYLPVIKAMIEEITGMDCEELIAMMEEKLFDGHKVAEVMWAIKNGHITKEDMQMWAMEKWEECEFAQMSEEEKMEWMSEFLGRFGIDCEKVQAGIEEMIGMKFEDIKKMFEDHMADHSGDADDINVDDLIDDVFPMDSHMA